jgi:hypothetical protein
MYAVLSFPCAKCQVLCQQVEEAGAATASIDYVILHCCCCCWYAWQCPPGAKYGADMPEVPGLLQLAKELGLQVRGIGISWQMGVGKTARTA